MPVTEDVQRVARAMLKDFEALMSAIVDRVWQTVPPYSTLLLERGDLADRIRENIHNVMVCLLEDRDPNPEELARCARNGERRALQGVSHAALIQSFRIAERTLSEEYTGWCSRMQVRPSHARAGRVTMIEMLDRLELAMLNAYTAMQQQISASNLLTEPTLFSRLAIGSPIDAAEVEELARVLGLEDTDQTRFVAVAASLAGDADPAAIERVRHHLVFRLTSATGATTLSGTVHIDAGPIALLALAWPGSSADIVPVVEQAIAETALRDPVRAAVGEPRLGLAQLNMSCRQAIQTLEIVDDTEPRRAVRYVDTLLEVLAERENNLLRELRARYLAPLGADLEETLRCYLDTSLSLAATATALHLHKNTVMYRLRRIEELSGVDLHDPRDIARVVLALDAS
ncbi:CdaR family transcriptional regulator [Homoserinibacter sp. GY 40078]|uniref:PucR family transcriptional regulator n=1 Tax=Homoserinibacter sp. GY 40078 TaxID=2603275 RepID=UPI0011C9F642|nr:helix-turn-helix domain-containing protein [Homoserinibacter sp. GY 40078]TXK16966.1 PucR family transcriptional regulator [Homoserinibacter sp. GY 40078]